MNNIYTEAFSETFAESNPYEHKQNTQTRRVNKAIVVMRHLSQRKQRAINKLGMQNG